MALGEEICLRGFVGGLLMRWFVFWGGNTIQALLFLALQGLLLVSLRLIGLVVVQFLAGWLLGWLRFRSGSISLGWMPHSLPNALIAFAILMRKTKDACESIVGWEKAPPIHNVLQTPSGCPLSVAREHRIS